MKILYVAYLDLKEESFAGVKKKIESQIKAFIKLKNEVNLLYISDEKICIKGKVEYEKNVKKGISNYRKAVYQEIINLSQDYDMIYIRFPGVMDFYTYQLIKKMCEKGIKCILEVPTYPIKGEYEKVLNTYWKEKKYIQYIKRILVYVMHYYYSNKLHKTNLKIVTKLYVTRYKNT